MLLEGKINAETLTYQVVQVTDKEDKVLEQLQMDTLAECKAAIRNSLISRGVVFVREERRPRKRNFTPEQEKVQS